jgi:hypothetical protein
MGNISALLFGLANIVTHVGDGDNYLLMLGMYNIAQRRTYVKEVKNCRLSIRHFRHVKKRAKAKKALTRLRTIANKVSINTVDSWACLPCSSTLILKIRLKPSVPIRFRAREKHHLPNRCQASHQDYQSA